MSNPSKPTTLSFFYRIVEGTKSQDVSIGSKGNILRWGRGDDNLGQQWLLLPCGPNRVHIVTLEHHPKLHCMSVGSNGNILRWELGELGNDNQSFSFVNPNDKGQVNIVEHTKGEYVSVGTHGNILRWGRGTGDSQRFKLEPIQKLSEPKLDTSNRHEPGAIPFTHNQTNFDNPPPESKRYLIDELVYGSVYVDDPRYDNIITQVREHHFYILRREQYWKLEQFKVYGGATTERGKVSFTEGMRTVTSRSMEVTIGMSLGVDMGFKFEPKLEYKDIGISGQSAGASMSQKMSQQLKIHRTTSSEQHSSETREQEYVVEAGKKHAIAVWSLVDSFQLLTADRKRTVGHWEIKDSRFLRRESHSVALANAS